MSVVATEPATSNGTGNQAPVHPRDLLVSIPVGVLRATIHALADATHPHLTYREVGALIGQLQTAPPVEHTKAEG